MTYRGHAKAVFGNHGRYQWIGLGISSFNYYGDLSPLPDRISTDISFTRPGISLSYGRRIVPHITLMANFQYGTIGGSDAQSAKKDDLANGIYRFNRNLSFRNRIKEFTILATIDLDKNLYFNERRTVNPYLLIGIGIIHHNPQGKVPNADLQGNSFSNSGEWINLRPLGTEGQYADLSKSDVNFGIKPYDLIVPVIPFGIGVRIKINERWDLTSEFSMRYVFTDYLDDVSKNYVDLGKLDSDLSRALSYRSNEITTPTTTYTSESNGQVYSVLSGYGAEHPENKRGNKNDNDLYSTFTIRISHYISRSHVRAPRYQR
jgi:hypothetical protein